MGTLSYLTKRNFLLRAAIITACNQQRWPVNELFLPRIEDVLHPWSVWSGALVTFTQTSSFQSEENCQSFMMQSSHGGQKYSKMTTIIICGKFCAWNLEEVSAKNFTKTCWLAQKLSVICNHEELTVAAMMAMLMMMMRMLYAGSPVRSNCRWKQVRTSELFRPREFRTLNDR